VLVDAAVIPNPPGIAMFNVPSLARKFPFASALTVRTMLAPELVTEYFAAIAVFALSPAASALATSVAVLDAVVKGIVTASGDPVKVDPVTVTMQLPLDVAPAAATTVAVSTCATPATNAALPVHTPVWTSSVAVVLDVVSLALIA
jgi:hypothetical protein